MGERKRPEDKILEFEGLEKFRKEHKEKKIIFTVGCYDIVHKGHIFFLDQCAKLGELLVVGLARDSVIQLLKGPQRPVNSEINRLHLIASLQNVDYSILNIDMVAAGRKEEYLSTKIDFKEILEKLKPDYFVLGYDTVASDLKKKMCKELGIKIHTITERINEGSEPLSSTSIIEKFRKK